MRALWFGPCTWSIVVGMDITNATVFIPGATSGIGLGLALRLQAAGSTVVVGGRRQDRLEAIAREHGLGTVRIDVADPQSITDVAATVIEQYPELDTVVTMSGLPASPGDRFPAWITTVWPPENLQLLEHQWTVAIDYWGALASEAQRRGVRVAVEMHANQLVYSAPGLRRLRAAVGETVGANFDPSHLLWMGADPIAAIAALSDNSLGATIHHVHAKDTRIEGQAAVTSRLETIPNERTEERAWNYVAVGTGHPDGDAFWSLAAQCLRDLQADHPELETTFARYDLFVDEFDHSCLNRLQLRNTLEMVDLSDQAQSLMFAGTLANPLARHRSP